MNITGRGPNGRLDPFSACMLLWSGALSFDDDAVTWDGRSHHITAPTVHQDVVSLYGRRREDVAGVLPDLLALLRELERDQGMRVPSSLMAEAVQQAIPKGDLSGMTLFLLQADAHPLIVEPVDNACVRVRYDPLLVRGIPAFQQLACRLVWRLRAFGGYAQGCEVLFVESANRGRTGGIHVFEGSVEGASTRVEPRVDVAFLPDVTLPSARPSLENPDAEEEEDPVSNAFEPDATGPADESPPKHFESHFLRAVCALESNAYTTTRLVSSTEARIKEHHTTCSNLEEAMPNPNDEQYRTPPDSSFGFPSEARAIRSLAIRSVIYLAIGMLVIAAGLYLLRSKDHVADLFKAPLHDAVDLVTQAVSIATGQTMQVTEDMVQLPSEPMANAATVVGLLLIGLGILWPVRRILAFKRRQDRELSWTRSHAAFLAGLTEKHKLNARASYEQATETWTQDLMRAREETSLAERELALLETTSTQLKATLDVCYASGTLPEGCHGLAAACTVADHLDAGGAAHIEGEDGALAWYQQELAQHRVSTRPASATPAQPTLRSVEKATSELIEHIRLAADEEGRLALVSQHCERASAAVTHAQGILATLA